MPLFYVLPLRDSDLDDHICDEWGLCADEAGNIVSAPTAAEAARLFVEHEEFLGAPHPYAKDGSLSQKWCVWADDNLIVWHIPDPGAAESGVLRWVHDPLDETHRHCRRIRFSGPPAGDSGAGLNS